MNDRSDFDHVLGYWLEDGPTTMPDRVVDVVARRIAAYPQRRSWRLVRRSPMTAPFKLLAAAAAVLVLAVVGYNLLPKGTSIGPPVPTASPAASPSAPASAAPVSVAPSRTPAICDESGATCSGLLPEGANSTVAFQPTLAFTVPRGWTNTLDKPRAYTLHYNFTRGHFLQVMSELAIPEQDDLCSAALKSGVGNRVADWVEFLTTHDGLETTAPVAVELGGFEGMQLDLHVAGDWTATCPDSLGPAVVLFTHSGAARDFSRWIDDQQVTLRIIDVAGETVIVYLESSPVAADLAALNQEFATFFDSFQFTPAG